MGWDRAATPAWTIPRAGPACKTDVSYAEQTMPKTPAPKTLRTTVLRVLLGFLVLTALVAIIDVWTDVDEDAKVLMSCLALSVASLLALPGAARMDRNRMDRNKVSSTSRASLTGLATLALTTLASITTLWLIWFEPQDATVLSRVVTSAWLWSLTVSLHAWVSLATLPERSMWLKIAAPILTYVAAVMATLVIFETYVAQDWLGYMTSTLYILAGLANLSVLIMHLMYRQERADTRLVLDGDGDGWRDIRSGRRYMITDC
jgi:hypothetical protein